MEPLPETVSNALLVALFHHAPQKAPGQMFTLVRDAGDDRTLYAELRAYASSVYMAAAWFLRERGLHLIWVNGRTQFALTHSVFSLYLRKYSVILDAPGQPIQVIFTFGAQASEFFQLVPVMDRIVESVRVDCVQSPQ